MFLFVAAAGAGLGFTSFVPGNACIDEVYRIYKTMKPADGSRGNVYMSYTQITHLTQKQSSDPEQSKTTVECIIGKNQVHYKSNEISVYLDSVDNFTVIPIRKVVFWSNSLLERGKQKRIKDFNILQDSLFFACQLLSCKTVSAAEGYNKVVEMAPEAKALKAFPYKKITFYIHTETQTIKRVFLELLEPREYKSIEIIYHKLELNYKKEDMNVPVKQLLLAKDNKLKGNYVNYKLVDNRNGKLKGKS